MRSMTTTINGSCANDTLLRHKLKCCLERANGNGAHVVEIDRNVEPLNPAYVFVPAPIQSSPLVGCVKLALDGTYP